MDRTENTGEGRLPSEDTKQGPIDISQIDCQEGTMERGETGGNFSGEKDDEDKKEKNPH